MPHRKLASRELAELFGALAHPERLRIIEELRSRECDVTTLATLLEVSPARASRHLALLRTHRLVQERQVGRRVYYALPEPALALWAAHGLAFVEARLDATAEIHDAAVRSRTEWTVGS